MKISYLLMLLLILSSCTNVKKKLDFVPANSDYITGCTDTLLYVSQVEYPQTDTVDVDNFCMEFYLEWVRYKNY